MRYGFVIDQRKCIGCHACSVACKSENRVPLGVYRTWVKYVEKGRFPFTRRFFQVNRCNHCSHPPCVTICPVGAMFQRKDGVVDFDSARCIGCKACMQACPYDGIYVDPATRTAAKCNYCIHRVDRGMEPACVAMCPQHAIVAGDLDQPDSEIARLVSREQVRVRKPEQGTGPKTFYVAAEEASMSPLAARYESGYLWAERNKQIAGGGAIRVAPDGDLPVPVLAAYDVRAPAPLGLAGAGLLLDQVAQHRRAGAARGGDRRRLGSGRQAAEPCVGDDRDGVHGHHGWAVDLGSLAPRAVLAGSATAAKPLLVDARSLPAGGLYRLVRPVRPGGIDGDDDPLFRDALVDRRRRLSGGGLHGVPLRAMRGPRPLADAGLAAAPAASGLAGQRRPVGAAGPVVWRRAASDAGRRRGIGRRAGLARVDVGHGVS